MLGQNKYEYRKRQKERPRQCKKDEWKQKNASS